MERSLPDSGKGLAEWWSQHGHHDASWTSTTYGELIDRAGPAGERHASTVSISLDMKAAGRAIRAAGGGNRGADAVLRQEMSTMTAALRAADLAPSGWRDPGDLAVILRSAYRPPSSRVRWGGTAISAVTSPPLGRSRSPRTGRACARTPRITACCGSASGRALWSTRAPSHPCCCLQAYAVLSRCSTRRCAPTRPPATSQEEDRVHLRRCPAPADWPDRGRPAVRRVQRRPPTGGRPRVRPRHPPHYRPHRCQHPRPRRARTRRHRHPAGRDPSVV